MTESVKYTWLLLKEEPVYGPLIFMIIGTGLAFAFVFLKEFDGVFIFCGLLAFYFCCLRIQVSDGEFSGMLLLCIISFHVIALVIALLVCLWRGALLWDVICTCQMGTSVLLLFFIPVLTFRCGD